MSTQMKCPYCIGVALVSSTGRMWCANCQTGSGKQEDDMNMDFVYGGRKYFMITPCIVVMTFPKGWAVNFGWFCWEIQFNFGGNDDREAINGKD